MLAGFLQILEANSPGSPSRVVPRASISMSIRELSIVHDGRLIVTSYLLSLEKIHKRSADLNNSIAVKWVSI